MSFYEDCSNDKSLSVIAGPCVFESKTHAIDMANILNDICKNYSINFIYKTSFDKANRSSGDSFRSVGFDEAFYGMNAVRETGIRVLTDVHDVWQCSSVSADILQIPAFLCRQTDLLEAAAQSGKSVNVKKGQFLSPNEMENVVKKLESFGCKEILLTERGTTFGYNNLVVDMRSLDIMKKLCYPVILDCTHAVQLPGGMGTSSGGQREFVNTIARAGVAVGIAGVFMEVHNDPDNAPCDGPNMLTIEMFERLINDLVELDNLTKRQLNNGQYSRKNLG